MLGGGKSGDGLSPARDGGESVQKKKRVSIIQNEKSVFNGGKWKRGRGEGRKDTTSVANF